MTPSRLEQIERDFQCVADVSFSPQRACEAIRRLLAEVDNLGLELQELRDVSDKLESLQKQHGELNDRYEDVKRALEDLIVWRTGPRTSTFYKDQAPLWLAAHEALKRCSQ